MKIYLAASAPGNETKIGVGRTFIKRRLLSYYLIDKKILNCDLVFQNIKEGNVIRTRIRTRKNNT